MLEKRVYDRNAMTDTATPTETRNLTEGSSDGSSFKDGYALGKWMDSWQSGQAKTITFILTEQCNLACKYCYLCKKNDQKRMSFETARACVDYILENRHLFPEKSVIWEFTGGEAFLEIDLLNELCEYIKRKMYMLDHPWFSSYRFSISSNGILYHTEKVQGFILKNIQHLSIGISVDGTKEKHDRQRIYPNGKGSYEDIVRNIPLWLSQFQSASTKATLSHDCLPLIKDSVINLWSLGIKNVAMNVVFENVWLENDDVIFADQIRELGKHILKNGLWGEYNCSLFTENLGSSLDKANNNNWCGSGKMLAIDTEGYFYPCNRFTGFSLNNHKPRIVGSVRDGIDTNKLRPFLALDRYSQSKEECLDCACAQGCAWCTGYNYDESESATIFSRATYICKMHKARVKAVRDFWNAFHDKDMRELYVADA